ncbi:MAG: hypothetical protein MJZ89_02210 [Paludibacteraceae bacterium]|nr:hypothetical protein [Paludibacteraceae bacterium]
MNTKTLLGLALCTTMSLTALAQSPILDAVEAIPAEENCVTYVSLFHESAKNKQYADAKVNWLRAYKTCPTASLNIYVDGVKICEWQLSQLKAGTAEYNDWRNLLMQVYDDRVKNYGNYPKMPASAVLGDKGVAYCNYFAEDETKAPAYTWLKESVEQRGAQSKITVVSKFIEVSLGLYKSDASKYGEQYIADYQLCSDIFNAMASDANDKNASGAARKRDYMDQVFAASGAADCNKLDELYAKTVSSNVDNLELLNKIMALYRRVNCVESDVYFAAAEASHKLAPTAESAAGCAAMCKKKEDWKGAIEYYDQATDMAESDEDKAEYLFRAASVLYDKVKNYPECRRYLRRSLEFKADQGRCYILMGILYANSKPYPEADFGPKARILNKTVYWAAVDKFNKAQAVDPTCAEEARKLVNSYAKYYPTKEERFDLPNEFSGSTFTVGGWIGETTQIR